MRNAGFTMWARGSVNRGTKSSNSSKVFLYVYERYCTSAKVVFGKVKVRSQKNTEKAQACRAIHVFWVILHLNNKSDGNLTPMTSSSLTFDGDQVKVRSNNVKV